eukprot:CAMPEP_0177665706 /NCGR_PEP_ID=MMETSP0447-20121125/21198_1 /TAXON_ID=0 /ORGANISM="Stygamoeba regulata, Strain BSH-02190019" /LENGTH=704 /DNA_ID=CAMNT_0019171819 /DNA_START=100 /DNA_END=2211 /DNA_ORIENTATION=-
MGDSDGDPFADDALALVMGEGEAVMTGAQSTSLQNTIAGAHDDEFGDFGDDFGEFTSAAASVGTTASAFDDFGDFGDFATDAGDFDDFEVSPRLARTQNGLIPESVSDHANQESTAEEKHAPTAEQSRLRSEFALVASKDEAVAGTAAAVEPASTVAHPEDPAAETPVELEAGQRREEESVGEQRRAAVDDAQQGAVTLDEPSASSLLGEAEPEAADSGEFDLPGADALAAAEAEFNDFADAEPNLEKREFNDFAAAEPNLEKREFNDFAAAEPNLEKREFNDLDDAVESNLDHEEFNDFDAAKPNLEDDRVPTVSGTEGVQKNDVVENNDDGEDDFAAFDSALNSLSQQQKIDAEKGSNDDDDGDGDVVDNDVDAEDGFGDFDRALNSLPTTSDAGLQKSDDDDAEDDFGEFDAALKSGLLCGTEPPAHALDNADTNKDLGDFDDFDDALNDADTTNDDFGAFDEALAGRSTSSALDSTAMSAQRSNEDEADEDEDDFGAFDAALASVSARSPLDAHSGDADHLDTFDSFGDFDTSLESSLAPVVRPMSASSSSSVKNTSITTEDDADDDDFAAFDAALASMPVPVVNAGVTSITANFGDFDDDLDFGDDVDFDAPLSVGERSELSSQEVRESGSSLPSSSSGTSSSSIGESAVDSEHDEQSGSESLEPVSEREAVETVSRGDDDDFGDFADCTAAAGAGADD